MAYFFHLLIIINIYIILALATNLLVGVTGLLSLSQAAFYGIGAYLTVLSLNVFNLTLIPSILFILLISGCIGLLIAYPSLKLKGDYFVLATLSFQFIVFSVFYNWSPITKGPYGISGILKPTLFGKIPITGLTAFLAVSTILTVIMVFIFHRLIYSPFGRLLKGIRDDEIAIMSIGRDVTRYKTVAFIISSGIMALPGIIFATYMSYIDPTSFNLDESIFILCTVLIGGAGNIKGPIVGSVFLVIIPEALRFIGLPETIAANVRQIIYGLVLIFLMRYRPEGIAGEYGIK